jgi:hypothetical protein
MIGKYRKKPVVIEAECFTLETWKKIEDWSDKKARAIGNWKHENDVLCMRIKTLEGTMTAELGDWIIRGVKGEFYPCKPDVFEATYELAADGGPS